MAGRGAPPKETHSRARDTARRRADVVQVSVDGELHGPELPDLFDWPPATRAWWKTWRESPQAQTFTATDWSFLLDTAPLHAEFWLGDRSVAAELRLRVAKFGATPEDRLRLKLAVGDPVVKTEPRLKTRATRARRDRLLKAVNDAG